ncbi:MAG: hypothetical protein EYC62_01940 [Alphaproteobacteria bacterium]|nr:MAG: hypothetical protein EYC62_01940 [Alphaproteobacteria bacterium]
MLALSSAQSPVAAGIKSRYYTAYEQIEEIAKIHGVLTAPLPEQAMSLNPVTLFQARHPTIGRIGEIISVERVKG